MVEVEGESEDACSVVEEETDEVCEEGSEGVGEVARGEWVDAVVEARF